MINVWFGLTRECETGLNVAPLYQLSIIMNVAGVAQECCRMSRYDLFQLGLFISRNAESVVAHLQWICAAVTVSFAPFFTISHIT